MAKVTLSNISNFASGAVTNINANTDAIELAFENTLSRDGTSPNTMAADLDMNSNSILNLPEPTDATEPLRLGDIGNIAGAGDLLTPSTSTDNAIVRFSGTSGKSIQSSPLTVSDTGVLAGLTGLDGNVSNTALDWPFVGVGVTADMGSFRIQQTQTVANSAPLLDVLRTHTHTGGTASVQATVRAYTQVNPGSSNHAWSGVFVLDNDATLSPASENVAINATARKRSTGWTWASNIVLEDHTANPLSGSLGCELDMYCNGTDNNNARIGLDMFTRVVPGQEGVWVAPTVYAGIRFSTGIGSTGGTFKNGVLFNDATFTKLISTTATASITDGIDLSASTLSGNAFKSTGFNVGSTGNLTAGTGTFTGNVGVTGTLASTLSITAGSGQAASAFLYAAGNNNGTRPSSSTGSAAIGFNYTGGAAAVDFWNTYTAGTPTTSFSWKQMTGAAAHTEIMTITPAGNLTSIGSHTGTAFIPSGSTVPTNGMYLPAANTLAFARNSAEFMRIDSNGLGIGGAAGSGVNFQITHATLATVRLVGNSVDFRMSALAGAAIFGTYSNDVFAIYQNAAEVARFTSAGLNLASTKVLQVNGTQVVGARDTGWTAMTGTANEATAYATGTITLIQLAERVKALQDALTTHGLIGT